VIRKDKNKKDNMSYNRIKAGLSFIYTHWEIKMSQLIKQFCIILPLCFFAFSVQGVELDEQAKSFCEMLRTPSKKADVEFSELITRTAEVRGVRLSPVQADRHHALDSLMKMSGWDMSAVHFDDLNKVDPNKRVNLCLALKQENLDMAALIAEQTRVGSFCEAASQPMQQPDEMLVNINAELATKMKITLKPEIAARYPALTNELLTAESSKSCGSTQKELDRLDEFGTEKRAKLCKIFEEERLSLKLLDIYYRTTTALIDMIDSN